MSADSSLLSSLYSGWKSTILCNAARMSVSFRVIRPPFPFPVRHHSQNHTHTRQGLGLRLQQVPLPVALAYLAALTNPEFAVAPDGANAVLDVETEHEQPPPLLFVIEAPPEGGEVYPLRTLNALIPV